MKHMINLFPTAIAALLICSLSIPAKASVPVQESVGEIIAAYVAGGAGFAIADPQSTERAKAFDAAIAKALDVYRATPTQDNWSNLRSEVEKAVRTSISLHRAALFNTLENGDKAADELFARLSDAKTLNNAAQALVAGDGLFAHIDRSVVFGSDPARAWKPRKKSASVAIVRLLENGDKAGARKQFIKLYDAVASVQKDRFDAFGQEVNDLIDALVEEICQ